MKTSEARKRLCCTTRTFSDSGRTAGAAVAQSEGDEDDRPTGYPNRSVHGLRPTGVIEKTKIEKKRKEEGGAQLYDMHVRGQGLDGHRHFCIGYGTRPPH
ncbi:hypothetical protein H6P81_004323 [Aristolochia fimbriata]|uniref:Uncharacterized protein n=1 Tax=Aristolochia fimbriata TaxID=158543 RepID=A0AAV7FF27_ARIFI|nr:hypothetical protein H6P81_004323 [Aristolochia fimbriata]